MIGGQGRQGASQNKRARRAVYFENVVNNYIYIDERDEQQQS